MNDYLSFLDRCERFLVVFLLILLVPFSGLYAATFDVNTTEDLVDVSPNDGVCLTESDNCSLRAAVMEANESPDADRINLPAGNYVLTAVGFDEDLAETGDLDITRSLSIFGDGASSTIIDGNAEDRILHIFPDVDAEITGVTLTNGRVIGQYLVTRDNVAGCILNHGALTMNDSVISHSMASRAGGIFNDTGTSCVLTNVAIAGNSALDVDHGEGGGILNQLADLTLTNVVVSNNQAGLNGGGINSSGGEYWGVAFNAFNLTVRDNSAGYHGGGIYAGGEAKTDLLEQIIVERNTATGHGGGIWGAISIRDFTIRENLSKSDGGGIALVGNGTINLARGRIEDNTAWRGGGIYVGQWGTAILDQITVQGNKASDGGGINNNYGSILTMSNSTINGNIASSYGGGFMNKGYDGPGGEATATLSNVTISGNKCDNASYHYGAGVFNSLGSVTLTNVTITKNKGGDSYGDGAGIFNSFATSGTVTVSNSIIAQNYWNNGTTEDNCGGTITSKGYNISNFCFSPPDETDILGVDPLLGALGDNGGLTQTHSLLSGSPAIDTGSQAECGAIEVNVTDQRDTGFPRTLDGDGDKVAVCDRGAVEYPEEFCGGVDEFLPLQVVPLLPPPQVCTAYNSITTQVAAGPEESFTVPDGAALHLVAPMIKLQSGFEVEIGGFFKATQDAAMP